MSRNRKEVAARQAHEQIIHAQDGHRLQTVVRGRQNIRMCGCTGSPEGSLVDVGT